MAFKAPNRFVAKIHKAKRKCGNCKHFDLAEGQKERAKSGVFASVTEVVPPSQVSGSRKEGEEAEKPTSPMPKNVKWEDFGSCMHADNEGLLIWAGDTCPKWK
jgi:hypothetical protein